MSLGNNNYNLEASACGASYKCLPYELSTVRYWPTVAITCNRELFLILEREPDLIKLEASARGASYKGLPYELSTVRYWPTVAITCNRELRFDSGEGA